MSRPAYLKRPATITPYMWRQFVDCFDRSCQFWTGEDGYAREIVIMRRPDAAEVLRHEWPDNGEPKLTEGWVYRGRMEDPEYNYLTCRNERRKVWLLSKTPTSFPVLVWDPTQMEKGARG